jgi:ketosteroid isomerase-like protein
MKRLTRCSILLVVAGLPIPLFSAGQSQDEAEIRNLQRRQQEAWNRHDAKAYADLFAESGDVVNVVGWWWKGRPEIESKLTEA